MRSTYSILILAGCLSVAHVATVQRTSLQPVEWILQHAADQGIEDMWTYVAPDGETITFSRTVDGRTWRLLVTDRLGTTPRPFLSAPPAGSLTRGAWSRPHARFAFNASRPEGGNDVYVTDVSGRDVQRVPLQGVPEITYPSWMPDGRSIVGVSYGSPGGRLGTSRLYRVDVTTGKSEALTSPAEFLVGMPSVSPDGQLIAFAGQRNQGKGYDQTKNQIWLMSIGEQPREISAGQGRQPDWSPDGRWLAFTSSRGDAQGRHAVFIVQRSGEHLIQLTDYTWNAQHPVWSPDGKWIVFAVPRGTDKGSGLARITVPELPR
jgi:Tol biopolymer transport system component